MYINTILVIMKHHDRICIDCDILLYIHVRTGVILKKWSHIVEYCTDTL